MNQILEIAKKVNENKMQSYLLIRIKKDLDMIIVAPNRFGLVALTNCRTV